MTAYEKETANRERKRRRVLPPRKVKARVPLERQLPPVCALCGAPATTSRRISATSKTEEEAGLQWWWLSWLFLLDKSPDILLPLCRRHRHFRRGWPFTAVGSIVLLMVLAFLCFWFICRVGFREEIGQVAIFIVLVSGGFVVGRFIERQLRIYAVHVGSREAEIVGAAPEFAQACAEAKMRATQQVLDRIDTLSSAPSVPPVADAPPSDARGERPGESRRE